jgi:hypothetical protein
LGHDRADLLAQGRNDSLVTGANLLAQGHYDPLVARNDLVLDGRKVSAHLVPELRNLHSEVIHAGRQLLENRHSLLQAFYPSFKGLRRHDDSIQVLPVDNVSSRDLKEMCGYRADETTLPSSPSAGKRPK